MTYAVPVVDLEKKKKNDAGPLDLAEIPAGR